MSVFRSTISVFCSYAHEDEKLYAGLKTHLSVLKHQGFISTWFDRQIDLGTEWKSEVDMHLEEASLILLLISPDFLSSEYCSSLEMRRALERHEARKARVIPIVLRPTDWFSTPFSNLQALPTSAKPVTTWPNRDAAFSDVVKGLRRVIEDLSIDLSDQKKANDLGPDFQARQQAISRVAKADPENIQEVAASQLSIINSYYQSGLQQSQQSFQWSLIRPSEKPLQRRTILSCFCKFGARFAAFVRSLLQRLEPDLAKLAVLNLGLDEKLRAPVHNSGKSGSRIYKNENDERASGAILPNSN